jgi:hypothetical protein
MLKLKATEGTKWLGANPPSIHLTVLKKNMRVVSSSVVKGHFSGLRAKLKR